MKIFSLPNKIKGANISNLADQLKNLHEQLSKVEQTEFEGHQQELTSVAAKLVESDLLKHNDKAVRLLVSCCLANILRLFAPDAPYNPVQLKDIFVLMVQQLKGLSDEKNAYKNYIFYLVENLATVKSVVLLLDIDDTNGERDRLLLQLFNLIFDLTPFPSISKTIKLYLLEIGQTLIDECDSVPSDIIQLLLTKCNMEGRAAEASKVLAAELVRACSNKLQPGIGLYFHEQCMQFTGNNDEIKRFEPLKQLHIQVMNIGKVAPEAIGSVIAQLEDELFCEDSELRVIAISSLATFFTFEIATKLYPNLWTAWLNKMNDRNTNVRIQWIKSAFSLLSNEASSSSVGLAKIIQTALVDKLQDVDAKVREKTLGMIKKFIDDGNSISTLGNELVREVGERCRDKNEDVRLHAIELLCHIINLLGVSEGLQHNPSTLFTLCVRSLFMLIYTHDRDHKLFYEYYIEHALLIPRDNINKEEHAQLLINVFRSLDEETRKAFKKILQDKALFVKYFDAYLKLVFRDTDRLTAVIQYLSSQFRAPLDAQVCLKAMSETILKTRDNFDCFRLLIDPSTFLEKQRKLVKSLTERHFDTEDARVKSYVIVYLARKASMLSVNSDILSAILAMENEHGKLLVAEIIGEFPAVGIRHSGMLETIICCKEDAKNNIKSAMMQIEAMSSYASLIAACGEKLKPSTILIEELWRLVENGERMQVKLAIRILLHAEDARNSLELLLGTEQHNMKNTDLIRYWQVACETAKDKSLVRLLDFGHILEKVDTLLKTDASTVMGSPQKTRLDSLKLNDFSNAEIAAVLSLKCLQNIIITWKSIDKSEELSRLRILAPKLVEWLSMTTTEILSARVKYTLIKIIMILVPRPTATTVMENLATFTNFCFHAPLIIRDRIHLQMIKLYKQGTIGLLYLVLPIICGWYRDTPTLKESLLALRRNDPHSDLILSLDDSSFVEINSQNLNRYEDLCILSLILTSLQSKFEPLDEHLTNGRFADIIATLTDIIATQNNISYLFDAAVQLKKLKFVERYSNRDKHLYVLSEMLQNALRQKATAHKWSLDAIKRPISIIDDLVVEIENIESVSRNVQKSYLTKMAHQHAKRKSDESTTRHCPQSLEVIAVTMDDTESYNQTANSNSTSLANVENLPVDSNRMSLLDNDHHQQKQDRHRARDSEHDSYDSSIIADTTPTKKPTTRRSERKKTIHH